MTPVVAQAFCNDLLMTFVGTQAGSVTRGKGAHSFLGASWKPLDGARKTGRDKIGHMLCESWRHLNWLSFTSSARRDAVPFRHTAYDPKHIGLVRELLHNTDGARHRKDTRALEGMALTVEAVWCARHAVRGGWTTTEVYKRKGFKLKARWLKRKPGKHKLAGRSRGGP